jgi:hypothetical protein
LTIVRAWRDHRGGTWGLAFGMAAILAMAAVALLFHDRSKPIILLDEIQIANEAIDLERSIETALGVADVPVPGELASKKYPAGDRRLTTNESDPR